MCNADDIGFDRARATSAIVWGFIGFELKTLWELTHVPLPILMASSRCNFSISKYCSPSNRHFLADCPLPLQTVPVEPFALPLLWLGLLLVLATLYCCNKNATLIANHCGNGLIPPSWCRYSGSLNDWIIRQFWSGNLCWWLPFGGNVLIALLWNGSTSSQRR